MRPSTVWWAVLVLVSCGAVVAFQVGKAPPSLPSLRTDLHLTLTQAGWTVSLLSVLAATCGVAIGLLAPSIGAGRMALAGLLLGGAASVAGSQATDATSLLAFRAVEGCGFIAALVAMPTLILRRSADRDVRFAMGLWSTYMPAGAATMMAAASLILAEHSWRAVWMAAGVAVLGAGAAVAVVLKATATPSPPTASTSLVGNISDTARTPGPWLLGACFGLYNGPWFVVAGFLPTLLIDRYGMSQTHAALATAAVAAANIVGNLGAGYVLSRGVHRSTLVCFALATMALASLGVFLDIVPVAGRLAGAVLFSMVGGLIPGALFSAAPAAAPRPELLPAVNGMMLQGSNIGSVFAPPIAAWLVGIGGWPSVLWFTTASLGLSAIAAILLGRSERRRRR